MTEEQGNKVLVSVAVMFIVVFVILFLGFVTGIITNTPYNNTCKAAGYDYSTLIMVWDKPDDGLCIRTHTEYMPISKVLKGDK